MTVQRLLKKRTAVSPEEVLADSAPGERGVRRLHGRRSGGLRATVFGAAAGGLHGRDEQAVDREIAGETAGRARAARALGARVRALRRRADLPVSGALDRSAACRDWRASHTPGLGALDPGQAERIALVMGNLNTHGIESLYETFAPQEARNLAERLEIHYTPKHGSWLNMAEIELSALCGQCLNRRIEYLKTMRREIAAWEEDRNTRQSKIDWHFTTHDARTKLKRLYSNL